MKSYLQKAVAVQTVVWAQLPCWMSASPPGVLPGLLPLGLLFLNRRVACASG